MNRRILSSFYQRVMSILNGNLKTINGNSIVGEGDIPISGTASWGSIGGTLSSQTDLQTALNNKQDTLVSGTNIVSINSNTLLNSGDLIIDKTFVGLANVDDTSDIDKPISNATQLALDGKENTIIEGTASQYYRGDKTFRTLDKNAVGLGNVDNTSDLNKPISNATQTALNGKENLITAGTISQYFRGDKTFQTLDKNAVGLSNVVNLDTSNPANIVQSSSYRFVTDTEKSTWNGKQDLLVSGTNIKTINSNSLLGSGNLTISASPSGLSGEIQFNNAGSFGSDSNLFWDNTNKRLGIGATPSTSVRLDVRSQGALSTDIAFRVRNSANNSDLFSIQGTNRIDVGEPSGLGQFLINGSARAATDLVFRVLGLGNQQLFSAQQNGVVRMGLNNNNITFDGTNWNITNAGNTNWNINANRYFLIGQASGIGVMTIGTLTIVTKSNSASEFVTCITNSTANGYYERLSNTNVKDIFNTIAAPTTNVTDAFRMYANDIVAGNSAPHFRTENGSVIRLYKETTSVASSTFVQNTGNAVNDKSTFGGYTIAQVVQALQNQGLL